MPKESIIWPRTATVRLERHSRWHFSREFKKAQGVTVPQFVLELRLQQAAEVLRSAAAPSAAGQRSAEVLRAQTGGTGLTALYRLVRQTVEHTLPAVPGRETRVTVREERVSAPAETLTEAGLDRALRRDSRRYDGGFYLY